MESIPPELVSQILSYLLHDDAPVQERSRPGFVNTEFISPSITTSAFRRVARPKLWSSLVFPVSSLDVGTALLYVVSSTPDICDFISEIWLPDAPDTQVADVLSRVICLLPTVTRLHMKAPTTVRSVVHDLQGWDIYPKIFFQALEQHVFPSLVYLQVQDLLSVPFASLLQCCPQLKTLDLTRKGWVSNQHYVLQDSILRSSSSKHDTHHVSSLKHLILRGPYAEQFFSFSNPSGNIFTAFGDVSVQLKHLSLNAWGWYGEAIAAVPPLIRSHASTLTTLIIRYSNPYFDFPCSWFQDSQFPSLRTLLLCIEWRDGWKEIQLDTVRSDILDSPDMRDIAQVVSSAPTLQTLGLRLKPARWCEHPPITVLRWEDLDRILWERNILIWISPDEEDADGKDHPLLFSKEAIWEVLPLAHKNGLLDVRDYDRSFDWCTSASE
ncbi:hypothetical protein DL96DRAFT_392859 [Flagelloscypha sp. PMI_526]|nr:hypothetical protein DL96DRAFT_392859 [Flagelloscypha sp. PMI_526]